MATITRENEKIYVRTPYNKGFIAGVKRIGGKWDGEKKLWIVSEDNEDLLNELLLRTIGCSIDGTEHKVQVVYDAYDFYTGPFVKLGTFITAERTHRDRYVQLNDETVIMSGEFSASGGSMKYPCIDVQKGDVILRSWIPATVFEKLDESEKKLLQVTQSRGDE